MFAPRPNAFNNLDDQGAPSVSDRPLTAAELGMLRWRSRRGLLENDLIISRFYERHGAGLSLHSAQALTQLLDLPDNELLDLLLGRIPASSALDHPMVDEVLTQLKPNPPTVIAA